MKSNVGASLLAMNDNAVNLPVYVTRRSLSNSNTCTNRNLALNHQPIHALSL